MQRGRSERSQPHQNPRNSIETTVLSESVPDDRPFRLPPPTSVGRRRPGFDYQAQLAAIVESSQDAILGKSLDGTITSWNAAAEKFYGYTAQEAIGQSIHMIVPPERSAELAEILGRIRAASAWIRSTRSGFARMERESPSR